MLNCKKCETLETALEFERERNKELLDRLMALVDARAYQAVKFDTSSISDDYYGGDGEVQQVRNEFGEPVFMKIKDERPV
jgi:hypothetical protein